MPRRRSSPIEEEGGAATEEEPAGGGGAAVSTANIQFDPSGLEVKAGDTITFTNDEAGPRRAQDRRPRRRLQPARPAACRKATRSS